MVKGTHVHAHQVPNYKRTTRHARLSTHVIERTKEVVQVFVRRKATKQDVPARLDSDYCQTKGRVSQFIRVRRRTKVVARILVTWVMEMASVVLVQRVSIWKKTGKHARKVGELS